MGEKVVMRTAVKKIDAYAARRRQCPPQQEEPDQEQHLFGEDELKLCVHVLESKHVTGYCCTTIERNFHSILPPPGLPQPAVIPGVKMLDIFRLKSMIPRSYFLPFEPSLTNNNEMRGGLYLGGVIVIFTVTIKGLFLIRSFSLKRRVFI